MRGHLTVKDQSTGQTIYGTVMTQMRTCMFPGGFGTFSGTDSNGRPFDGQANDMADPGAGSDTFSINGMDQNGTSYGNSGVLLSGNIQMHGFSCH